MFILTLPVPPLGYFWLVAAVHHNPPAHLVHVFSSPFVFSCSLLVCGELVITPCVFKSLSSSLSLSAGLLSSPHSPLCFFCLSCSMCSLWFLIFLPMFPLLLLFVLDSVFFYYYFYTSCVFATCLFWSCVWTLKPSEWSCLRKVHLLLCYLPSFVCCILPSLLQWDNWCTAKRYPVVIISLLTLTWYRYSYYIARNDICSRPLTCVLCNLFLSHCHQNTISCFCCFNETCISPMYKEHKK